MKRETLQKKEILRKRKEIERVKRKGKRMEDELFIVHYFPGKREVCFGVRGKIPEATERNFLKRRLREVYRRNKELFPAHLSYFLGAKRKALILPFSIFRERLLDLVQRCQ
ncbi:MAG: ribonuclease P protein component [candidate division WOR-3 bacterium]